jgi:prepilin-type N-terminal cleavage/methylation domain-containing protein
MDKIEEPLMRKHDERIIKGFTVIEILITLLIFSIAMLGSMKLLKLTIQSNDYAEDLLLAMTWGKSTVENLKMIPLYDADAPTVLNSDIFSDGEHRADVGIASGATTYFNRSWTVYPITGSDSKRIEVKMWWDDRGTTRYQTISFIKGRNSG